MTCQEYVQSIVELSQSQSMAAPLSFRLLAAHGKPMFSSSKPLAKLGREGECDKNSFERISASLRYAEGYASTKSALIPLAHAWLVNDAGEVLDPTWDDGVDYFGVVFQDSFVYEVALRTGRYGILDSLYTFRDIGIEELYSFLELGIAT